MITDKDRIDFLQANKNRGYAAPVRLSMTLIGERKMKVREIIDLEMDQEGEASRPDFYCGCGVGYNEYDDMDGPDGNLPCIHSTDVTYHPNGNETWHSTYKCRFCGEEFTVEEGI